MTVKTSYRWLLTFIVSAVFIAQSFSLAHATRYSDADHDHNGVACDIALTSAEDVAIIPTLQTPLGFTPVVTIAPDTFYVSVSYITPQGRAPPPRSPPFAF